MRYIYSSSLTEAVRYRTGVCGVPSDDGIWHNSDGEVGGVEGVWPADGAAANKRNGGPRRQVPAQMCACACWEES